MYGGLSKKLVCFLFIQMGMNGFQTIIASSLA